MFKQLLSPFFCIMLFFSAISTPELSSAQNPTPNAGFEDWTLVNFFGTFYIPNSWDNLDSATAIIGILTCQQTTDAHSGSFAVKLVTYEVDIFGKDTANGIMSTGNIITIPPYGVVGGITYHERPDSVAGWFKYTPAGGDSTFIQFDLFSGSGDTIGSAFLKIGSTISNYTRFAVPVKYFSTATPEYSRWLISGSNGYSAVPGTVLYVDDLEVLFSTGIDEVEKESGMRIVNTLVTDQLIISNPKNLSGTLELYSAIGNLEGSYPVSRLSEQIHLPHLENGMYFCSVMNNDGATLLRKKIVVQQ